MLVTFILGALAGILAEYAEPHVKKALEGVALAEVPLSAVEQRLLTFALCLAAAALLALLLGNGNALALALGAVAGVFGPRLLAKSRGNRGPDYDD